jgi:4-diphosphocytidyl-2-C-methyl-D-erythritol kinase
MIERAPAKLNLCLHVGPLRADGRHELVSVMEPLALHDTDTLGPARDGADEVVCPGVEGPNLAGTALARFREATGWDGEPVRLEIEKRIPVAAGMAGGSADAAAALRLAQRASGLGDDELLLEIAAGLGSDVPSQVRPRRVLVRGAGERLDPAPPPQRAYGLLVLPTSEQLSTAAVYRRFDELGRGPTEAELDEHADRASAAIADGRLPPFANDLEPAARSLCPAVDEALAAARGVGAAWAMVSGSGPTVVGFFDTPAEAEAAAVYLADHGRSPAPIATRPLAT